MDRQIASGGICAGDAPENGLLDAHAVRRDSPVSLAVVVPCYNEEEVLPETSRRLLALLGRLVEEGVFTPQSSICFVDDGSRDGTWRLIERLASMDSRVHGVKLSRNRGHQHALMAGLF